MAHNGFLQQKIKRAMFLFGFVSILNTQLHRVDCSFSPTAKLSAPARKKGVINLLVLIFLLIVLVNLKRERSKSQPTPEISLFWQLYRSHFAQRFEKNNVLLLLLLLLYIIDLFAMLASIVLPNVVLHA